MSSARRRAGVLVALLCLAFTFLASAQALATSGGATATPSAYTYGDGAHLASRTFALSNPSHPGSPRWPVAVGVGLSAGAASRFAAEEGRGLGEGANGALRDPATGRFAPDPDRVAPEPSSGVHGNSRLSDAPTSLYRLEDLNGNYLKTGITSNPGGRYTQDFMSDKFMNIINVGSRSNMMDLERLTVEVDPGPLNFEPWAGAAQ